MRICWLLFCFRLKHAQSELKKKQSELKNTEKSYKKDKDVYDAIEKSKSKLEVCVQCTCYTKPVKNQRKNEMSVSLPQYIYKNCL